MNLKIIMLLTVNLAALQTACRTTASKYWGRVANANPAWRERVFQYMALLINTWRYLLNAKDACAATPVNTKLSNKAGYKGCAEGQFQDHINEFLKR